jgi:hypothetical protein
MNGIEALIEEMRKQNEMLVKLTSDYKKDEEEEQQTIDDSVNLEGETTETEETTDVEEPTEPSEPNEIEKLKEEFAKLVEIVADLKSKMVYKEEKEDDAELVSLKKIDSGDKLSNWINNHIIK